MDRKAQCAGSLSGADESVFQIRLAHSSDAIRLLEEARDRLPGSGDTIR